MNIENPLQEMRSHRRWMWAWAALALGLAVAAALALWRGDGATAWECFWGAMPCALLAEKEWRIASLFRHMTLFCRCD